MSKKTLLNEASVRKFMKFAKIDRYADNFINETYAPMEEEEKMREGDDKMREERMEEGREDKMEEGRGDKIEEAAHDMEEGHGMGMHDKMEEGMYTEEEHDESPAPPADDDAGAMEGTVDLDTFMDAFETALEQATGEDVEVDMGDDEMAMDDESAEEDEEDEVAGGMEMVDDEEVLEETLRRVTRRLNRMVESKKGAARKARMVESATDRIMARILKSE